MFDFKTHQHHQHTPHLLGVAPAVNVSTYDIDYVTSFNASTLTFYGIVTNVSAAKRSKLSDCTEHIKEIRVMIH
jgi:hypothetical protein